MEEPVWLPEAVAVHVRDTEAKGVAAAVAVEEDSARYIRRIRSRCRCYRHWWSNKSPKRWFKRRPHCPIRRPKSGQICQPEVQVAAIEEGSGRCCCLPGALPLQRCCPVRVCRTGTSAPCR
jgi:hypothetical protein